MPQIVIPNPIIKMCTFRHTAASGNGGGGTTANTFIKRPLSATYFQTSEPSNSIFTLDDANDEIDFSEAGLYYIYCETFAFTCGRFYSALRAMNGVTRVLGSSNAAATSSNVSSTISGFFTVVPGAIGTTAGSFAIYTKAVNSRASDGLGTPMSLDSEIETYATGYIQKIRNLIPSEE